LQKQPLRSDGWRCRFSEDQGGEEKDVGVLVPPGIRGKPGLQGGLLQKGFSVPTLFRRDLGKKQAFVGAILHEQPILSDAYLLGIKDAAHR
jgi:hypothetical protein